MLDFLECVKTGLSLRAVSPQSEVDARVEHLVAEGARLALLLQENAVEAIRCKTRALLLYVQLVANHIQRLHVVVRRGFDGVEGGSLYLGSPRFEGLFKESTELDGVVHKRPLSQTLRHGREEGHLIVAPLAGVRKARSSPVQRHQIVYECELILEVSSERIAIGCRKKVFVVVDVCVNSIERGFCLACLRCTVRGFFDSSSFLGYLAQTCLEKLKVDESVEGPVEAHESFKSLLHEVGVVHAHGAGQLAQGLLRVVLRVQVCERVQESIPALLGCLFNEHVVWSAL